MNDPQAFKAAVENLYNTVEALTKMAGIRGLIGPRNAERLEQHLRILLPFLTEENPERFLLDDNTTIRAENGIMYFGLYTEGQEQATVLVRATHYREVLRLLNGSDDYESQLRPQRVGSEAQDPQPSQVHDQGNGQGPAPDAGSDQLPSQAPQWWRDVLPPGPKPEGP